MEKSTGGRQRQENQKKKKRMTIYTVDKIQEPKTPEEPPKEEKFKPTSEDVGQFIGTVFLTPLVLMFAWNFVMPTLFGLITINYFQSFGLLIISRCFRQ